MTAWSQETCVVVGASLAGLRSAEGLRRGGFAGQIVVVGEEPHLPYNRPPLSKAALTNAASGDPELFRLPATLGEVEWLVGRTATAVDLDDGILHTADGAAHRWDGLVVASGLRPRRLDLPGPTRGRHVLRTVEDAAGLARSIRRGSSAVVVGAGFIGCEVAMTLAGAGMRVHLMDPFELPMLRQLGTVLAAQIRDRLVSAGVRMHLGTTIASLDGDSTISSVQLSDGVRIDTEVVVEAIGSIPNVEWLSGNGLDLSDGVSCDTELRVEGRANVVACGDVARFAHPLRRGDAHRIEHWMMAGDTGRRAGANLVAGLAGREPDGAFAPVPSFWSDLGDTRIQSFGVPAEGLDDVRVLEGDLEAEAAVGYHRGDILVGVVLLGLGGRQALYRKQIGDLCKKLALTARALS